MVVPNFICGGAAKSGTTTLYDILKDHPDIYLSDMKEPLFFNYDDNYKQGLTWYSKAFFKNYKNEKIIGDFTPSYLSSPEAPKRIYESLGADVKFLFILRHPVDRAYSQFLHNRRDQTEQLDFLDSLSSEEARMAKFKNENDNLSIIKLNYIQQSVYTPCLQPYMDIFGRDNVMVLIFEEAFADVDFYVLQVLNFLSLQPAISVNTNKKSNTSSVARFTFIEKAFANDSAVKRFFKRLITSKALKRKIVNKIRNLNLKPQEYEKLNKDLRNEIFNKYFAKDVTELEVLLNRNLDGWKK